MLAPRNLLPEFAKWNARWHAPDGRTIRRVGRFTGRSQRELRWRRPRWTGPFDFQLNNTTRVFEYPWTFHAVPVGARSTVLEIGGVSVLDLIQSSELDLVVGEPAQLFGFPESDPDGVRDRLNEYLVGFSDARAVCGPAEMNGLLTP